MMLCLDLIVYIPVCNICVMSEPGFHAGSMLVGTNVFRFAQEIISQTGGVTSFRRCCKLSAQHGVERHSAEILAYELPT